MKEGDELFEVCSKLYPQPIALGCGRICRARSLQERLDAILKCAEVVTRYLASVAISSIGAREDSSAPMPTAFKDLAGNLSFGHFLSIAQSADKVTYDHPFRSAFTAGFKSKGSQIGKADAGLVKLLEIRNQMGHDLLSMSDAKSAAVLGKERPEQALKEALEALEPVILRPPLFLVEQQRLVSRKIVARRLLLMGEAQDPTPEEVELSDGLMRDHALYVGFRGGALCLYPFLTWDLVESKAHFNIYFLDSIGDREARYKTVNGDLLEYDSAICQLISDRLAGDTVAAESVTLADGTSFVADWRERQKQILGITSEPISWEALDEETVRWFGKHLGASGADAEIRQAVIDRLFDGREQLNPDEIRQVHLLFGREPTVRRLLKRGLIDCRARKDPETRWDERVELSANVLTCLKLAIEFFSKHVGAGTRGVTIDGLSATAGNADYIAMREGLVNLFIHQNYHDPSTVAQIEITPERAIFFNAGKSLVSDDTLVDGGKSQSRNPILSRALRLIGFAELAGSGLREIHRAWRQVRRRPPTIEF